MSFPIILDNNGRFEESDFTFDGQHMTVFSDKKFLFNNILIDSADHDYQLQVEDNPVLIQLPDVMYYLRFSLDGAPVVGPYTITPPGPMKFYLVLESNLVDEYDTAYDSSETDMLIAKIKVEYQPSYELNFFALFQNKENLIHNEISVGTNYSLSGENSSKFHFNSTHYDFSRTPIVKNVGFKRDSTAGSNDRDYAYFNEDINREYWNFDYQSDFSTNLEMFLTTMA